ncbi:MAG: heme-binding domain-containing protein [Pyrinomonadaceae bacterium]
MRRKILKIAIIVLVAAFVLAQFVRPDQTAPATIPAETLEASTEVPDDVAAIFARSCADCHTNNTYYPWYSQVAPVNWWLDNHVKEGRRELNFSVWATYADKRKARKLDEICEQVQKGEMPLPSYLWVHRDAGLKPGESERICEWTRAEKAKLPPQQ